MNCLNTRISKLRIAVIVAAFLGCCGAIRENSCIIMWSGILLFIMFVVGLAGAFVAGSVIKKFPDCKNPTEDFVKESMYDSIAQQKVDSKIIWEEMQQRWKCCGVSGHDDYLNNNITIPASCFNQNETYDSEQHFTADEAYKPGCYKVLVNAVNGKMTMLGRAALCIALIECLGWMYMCGKCSTISLKKEGLDDHGSTAISLRNRSNSFEFETSFLQSYMFYSMFHGSHHATCPA